VTLGLNHKNEKRLDKRILYFEISTLEIYEHSIEFKWQRPKGKRSFSKLTFFPK